MDGWTEGQTDEWVTRKKKKTANGRVIHSIHAYFHTLAYQMNQEETHICLI